MKDCCGTFTMYTTDGGIATVHPPRRVLYYVPFENLTTDEIDSLNTKMRNAPEVMGLRDHHYEEVSPLDCSNIVPDPLLDTYVGVLTALPDCDIVVTIASNEPSPSRDALIEFSKKLKLVVYYVSEDGKITHIYDFESGVTRSIGYC